MTTPDLQCALTGPAHLEQHLARAHLAARTQATPYTLARIDLDHFHRFRHDAARLLQTITHTLLQHCRTEDIIARTGDDEFTILFPGLSADDVLPHLMALSNRMPSGLTASMGVVAYAHPDEAADSLLSRAGRALARAKAAGRDLIMVDEEEWQAELVPAL